jgi:hypothetical protein
VQSSITHSSKLFDVPAEASLLFSFDERIQMRISICIVVDLNLLMAARFVGLTQAKTQRMQSGLLLHLGALESTAEAAFHRRMSSVPRLFR